MTTQLTDLYDDFPQLPDLSERSMGTNDDESLIRLKNEIYNNNEKFVNDLQNLQNQIYYRLNSIETILNRIGTTITTTPTPATPAPRSGPFEKVGVGHFEWAGYAGVEGKPPTLEPKIIEKYTIFNSFWFWIILSLSLITLAILIWFRLKSKNKTPKNLNLNQFSTLI